VRLVLEHQGEHESQWAAIVSVAAKIGCTAEALRRWVRQAERDGGKRPGLTSAERDRLKQLERENLELKRANEILRKASAYFAQAELVRARSQARAHRKGNHRNGAHRKSASGVREQIDPMVHRARRAIRPLS
jgi:transposase